MKLFNNYLNSISDIINKSDIKNFSSFTSESQMPAYFEKSMLSENFEIQRNYKAKEKNKK